MSDRDEVRRLLLAAESLSRDVRELPGKLGHRAVLEPSEHGSARKIHISRDGVELYWTFSLEAGEPRPDFYPSNIPFLDNLPAVVTWSSEAGLMAKWMVPGFEERIRALAHRVTEGAMATAPREITEMAERMSDRTPEEGKELLQGLRFEKGSPAAEWVRGVFGEPASTGLPEEAEGGLKDILRFHEEAGWAVADGESGPAQKRFELRKGTATRQLHAISIMGITIIDLSERG